MVWLTNERRSAYFQPGHCQRSSPSRISNTNLQHAASRIWTCTELEFSLSWMNLCSSDNHCTMTLHQNKRVSLPREWEAETAWPIQMNTVSMYQSNTYWAEGSSYRLNMTTVFHAKPSVRLTQIKSNLIPTCPNSRELLCIFQFSGCTR